MKLKTHLSNLDIQRYYNLITNKFNHQNDDNLLDKITQNLQNNYKLALVINDQDDILGFTLCKIEEDFFFTKKCHIIDFEIIETPQALSQTHSQAPTQNDKNAIALLLYDFITQISEKFLCQKLLFSCLTKEKFLQKFFLSKKFTLEEFALKKIS